MSPSVVEPTDGYVVAMSGTVDPGMVIALYRTIAATVDDGHPGIVIDLSAVTFLGDQTAGLFCGALRLLERRGAVLQILVGPQPVQRMLIAGGGSPRATQAKKDTRSGDEPTHRQAGTAKNEPRTATYSPPQFLDTNHSQKEHSNA